MQGEKFREFSRLRLVFHFREINEDENEIFFRLVFLDGNDKCPFSSEWDR